MEIVREILGTANCVTDSRLASGEVRLRGGRTARRSIRTIALRGSPSQTALHAARSASRWSATTCSRETRFSVPAIVARARHAPRSERAGAGALGRAPRDPGARASERSPVHGRGRALPGGGRARDRRRARPRRDRGRAAPPRARGPADRPGEPRAAARASSKRELRHAGGLDDRVCVLALDLDRFKVVNDTLGHTVGDTLLRQVAGRLTACVREEDLVARPGGDEFAVVCTRTDTEHAIAEVAQRLVDAVVEPFEIDGSRGVHHRQRRRGGQRARRRDRRGAAARRRRRDVPRQGARRRALRGRSTSRCATGWSSGWRSRATCATRSSATSSSSTTSR